MRGMERVWRVWTALALLLLTLFVGQMRDTVMHAPPAPMPVVESKVRVRVQVTAPDSMHVEGVEIRAILVGEANGVTKGARTEATALTAADGSVLFAELRPGAYWFLAVPPPSSGLARASTSTLVAAEDGETQDISLELAPERLLRVRVEDEQGEPFADARLEARAEDPFPIAGATGVDGTAELRGFRGARARLRVEAVGYEPVILAAVVTRTRDEPDVVRVVLKKLGRLTVSVIGPDGTPASGASVQVASAVLWPARVTTTKPDGTALIVGLPYGSYAVRATQGDALSATDVGVVVAPGEDVKITVQMVRGQRVVVRVVEGERERYVQNARVTLVEGGLSSFPQTVSTDREGKAILGPFLGEASLSVFAEDLVGETAVRVPSPPPPELVVRLERGATIEGEIVDARGRPIEGATVRIVGTDLHGQPIDDDPRVFAFRQAHARYNTAHAMLPAGELGVIPGPVPPIPHVGASTFEPSVGSVEANAPRAEPWVSLRNGRFKAYPVTPGRVFALVRHPEFLPGQSAWIEVKPESRHNVRVVLERGGNVEGVVVDARGRPVGGALVRLASAQDGRQVLTASDGTFAFAAVASPVVLLGALSESPEEVLGRAELDVPEGTTQKVTLSLDDVRDPVVVRVEDERGHGLEFAQVTAMSMGAEVQRKVTGFSDDRGEVELRGLRGLPLVIETMAPGYAPERTEVLVAEPHLRVALSPSERVTGEVRGERGTVQNARVTLETAQGTRTVLTDADGQYSVGDLHPGAVTLRVRAEGFAEGSAHGTIRNERGRRATELPRVTLSREATASGTVVDEEGNPVSGARVAFGTVPVVLAGENTGALARVVLTDRNGEFMLGQLPEGRVSLEAYAVGIGRGRIDGVQTERGRESRGLRIVLHHEGDPQRSAPGGYGVAITLGESRGEVIVVHVVEGSQAEQAGLREHDVIESVQGIRVGSIEAARARLDGSAAEDVVVQIRRESEDGAHQRTLRIRREPVRR